MGFARKLRAKDNGEKGIDVDIAIEIMRWRYTRSAGFDEILLMSGDRDLLQLKEEAKALGKTLIFAFFASHCATRIKKDARHFADLEWAGQSEFLDEKGKTLLRRAVGKFLNQLLPGRIPTVVPKRVPAHLEFS